MRRGIGIVAILVIIILLGIGGAFLFYTSMLKPVSKEDEKIDVTIEEGTTTVGIGEILKSNDLIKNELVYKIYVSLNKINDMKAGSYELSKKMSLREIVDALVSGENTANKTINITFLEGKNMRWIAKTIAEKTTNTEENVFETLSDESYLNELIQKYWFITEDIKNKDIYYSLEGYIFPDTYNFKDETVSVQDIFNTMLDEMESNLEPYKTEMQNSGLSVHKLLTVASIVELESSNKEDRGGVSSVIYNRIKYNMAIGSDVTTYYAIKVDMSERDLKNSELNSSNGYNTRGPNMGGKLPIGPICTVSKSSIEAALHPDDTKYLYFVADKNGKVYFANSNEEHQQNVKKLKNSGLWYSFE